MNNKWRLMLYHIAIKWRWITYLFAALIVFIPIGIVIVTDSAFNSFYSKFFVSTAIALIIMGKSLAAYKKTIEYRAVPWADISGIMGLLIVLVWGIVR